MRLEIQGDEEEHLEKKRPENLRKFKARSILCLKFSISGQRIQTFSYTGS